MVDINVRENNASRVDEIYIRDIFGIIWLKKIHIIVITLIVLIAALIYVKNLPNVYKSEVLVMHSEDGSPALPGQLGGLAALAGVNVNGKDDKSKLAIQILKSRYFITKFISKYDLAVPLMASVGWDAHTDSLIIDDKVYDEDNKKWVRQASFPFTSAPSSQELYSRFLEILFINRDLDNGTIKISIEFYSPSLAKKWVDALITEINNEIRDRDLTEALNSIDYLESQVINTNIAGVRTLLFSMIEDKVKVRMLANIKQDYALQIIDPAVVPEVKSGPKRIIILLLIAVISVFFSMSFFLISHFFYIDKFKKKNKGAETTNE